MPKKPAPFQAPSINLTAHGKEWRNALPSELEVGDHILNYGIIAEIRDGELGQEFVFNGITEAVHFAQAPVQAFTKKAAEGE